MCGCGLGPTRNDTNDAFENNGQITGAGGRFRFHQNNNFLVSATIVMRDVSHTHEAFGACATCTVKMSIILERCWCVVWASGKNIKHLRAASTLI